MDGDLCEHYNSLDPSKRRNIAEELDRTPAEVKKQDNRRGRAQEGRAGRGGAKKSTRGQVRARKSTRERGGARESARVGGEDHEGGGGREGRNSEILINSY